MTYNVSSNLLQRSADKTSCLFILKRFSSPPQLLRPLVFYFLRFYHCPSKKNQFRWKAKQEEPKKKTRRESVKKMTDFSEDPPAHKPQIPLPPFGSEALWDWKQWSRGQPPAESPLCPTEGHMGSKGPQKGQGGPPDHRPREAPHTLAAKGQWGPGKERERGRRRVKESRRGLPGIG